MTRRLKGAAAAAAAASSSETSIVVTRQRKGFGGLVPVDLVLFFCQLVEYKAMEFQGPSHLFQRGTRLVGRGLRQRGDLGK